VVAILPIDLKTKR
jgi:hypothetical protein